VEQFGGFGVVPDARVVDGENGQVAEVADDDDERAAGGGGCGWDLDTAVVAGILHVPVDVATAAEVAVESLGQLVEPCPGLAVVVVRGGLEVVGVVESAQQLPELGVVGRHSVIVPTAGPPVLCVSGG